MRLLLLCVLAIALPITAQSTKKKIKQAEPISIIDIAVPKSLDECSAIKDDRIRLASYDKFAQAQRTLAATFKPEERQAIDVCLKSIRRLQAATKVGLNKIEYGRQVIEMAQTFDESITQVKEGTIRQLIVEARDQFVEAQEAWDFSFIAEYANTFSESEIGKRLTKKYGFCPKDLLTEGKPDFFKIQMRFAIINPIWSAAERRMIVATELFKNNLPIDQTAIDFINALDNYQRSVWSHNPSEDLKKAIPNWHNVSLPAQK